MELLTYKLICYKCGKETMTNLGFYQQLKRLEEAFDRLPDAINCNGFDKKSMKHCDWVATSKLKKELDKLELEDEK